MSLATLEPADPRLFEAAEPDPAGLDRLLVGLWETLTSGRSVACPVCGGDMRAEHGTEERFRGGCCEECGSSLS